MPYIYKEYPRTLHKFGPRVCTVRNDDEKAAALANGWSLLPVDVEPVWAPVPVTEPDAAPQIDDAPRRGRRKATVN